MSGEPFTFQAKGWDWRAQSDDEDESAAPGEGGDGS